MCGIAGIITQNPNENTISRIKNMTDIIAHRGPDGEGQWISKNGNIGLGHRRLSIIDLTENANQPMHFLNRYSIVFNGEIYNYIELKETLIKQGYKFYTDSDTEVLMALYDRDKEKCLHLLDGMFSFVIYDEKENSAFCARDRFGEKPFFYSYKKGEYFLFGSEMKCLWAGGIEKQTNNRMLYNYLSFGFLDNPQDLSETFYENITRLPHAHFIKINLQTVEIKTEKYYDIDWKKIDNSITIKGATEKFHELFYTSVSRRLRSDVAVGSSLSGGLDSSLVVCTIDDLKKGTQQLQKTFSAVFPGFAKDERKYMDYVIAKTKVKPYFVTPTDEAMLQDIEKLNWHQEEPYGSASIYVQYKVMQLAKENNVTVLLDGQGADEILAGYHEYFVPFFNELKNSNNVDWKNQKEKYFQLHSNNNINGITKKSLGNIVREISPALIKPLKKIKTAYNQFANPIFYKDFYNQYKNEVFESPISSFATLNESLYSSTFGSGAMQQLLRYADRNSMAHSREVRLPFLNHELVEFLFSLPATMKINNGWTKWIMRESFPVLPKEIGWRKDKIGYEPPQKKWMENEIILQKIKLNKEKLVNEKILNAKQLIKSKSSGDKNKNSWTNFMAGNL